jgi:hypothetical protein
MRRLRLLGKLVCHALVILNDRQKALRERPPRELLIVVLLLLLNLAAPALWLSGMVSPARWGAWAILFIAQIAVLLRHPFNPRKAVIHPLPVWYFWTVQALCASSALFLLWRSTPLLPAPRSGMLHLLGIAYLLSVASLATTALPPFLASLEAGAGCLGFSRKVISASNLYLAGLLVGTVGLAVLTSERLILFFCVAIALPGLIAMIRHRTLWKRETAVGLAVLPQAGIWLVPLIILASTANLLPKYAANILISTIVVLLCFWALYSLLVRLRKSPVDNPGLNVQDEALSVQTDPSRYVDTRGHGNQLLAFISRSDGGVLGLTGVRGAGKSALIAYTLSQLKRRHFLLSMTAPVRHDPGIGFLSSVCRAVCRQVLDDLHPILYGEETDKVRAWTEIFVRMRNFGITAAVLFSAGLALTEWRFAGKSPLLFWQSAPAGSLLEKIGWIVLAVVVVLLLGGPAWRALSSLTRAVANWKLVALYREAQQFLELLNYSESLETKGSIAWKVLTLERSRSLAARDLTLPGLTTRYVEFVRSVRDHYNGKLIIAIDELDKVHDPEMVKALLTEIKGALFSKGCYYLISISEDARRAFRKRLSAGRDIFESTFDEIIAIPQMSVTTAFEMIGKRLKESDEAKRIPDSCHFVLALAGGGIPREIVRHLRAVSLAHEKDAAVLQPGLVATEIFRCEARDWEAGIAESELSGDETVALRNEARKILDPFSKEGLRRGGYRDVKNHLEKCLKLIDLAGLRRKIVLLPGLAAEKEPAESTRYRALIDDIQGCLRLMILTIVCELAWKGDETWRAHEEAILAAHRALTDKPALAEALIGEIWAVL